MNETHQVISAFLDGESFDPASLAEALSDPAGRTLLIDLVALRHIVQPDDASLLGASASPARRSLLRRLVAAAAMIVALAGGYFMGERRGAVAVADPPAPTRVVHETAWQTLPTGGGR
jgi:hypothetical protein